MPKKSPVFERDSDTQTRILDTATMLFAVKGFKSVSLKEIAQAVEIKVPSIYYYYGDKDALIEAVLDRFGEVYEKYYQWLAEKNETARTLEDVIGNLFNPELLIKLNPVARMGMSMVQKEQHNHQSAYRSAVKNLYDKGIRNIQRAFDKLVERAVIPPSDTLTLATIFMFCIMCGNDIIIHEVAGQEVPVNATEVYNGLRQLMEAALREGLIQK